MLSHKRFAMSNYIHVSEYQKSKKYSTYQKFPSSIKIAAINRKHKKWGFNLSKTDYAPHNWGKNIRHFELQIVSQNENVCQIH